MQSFVLQTIVCDEAAVISCPVWWHQGQLSKSVVTTRIVSCKIKNIWILPHSVFLYFMFLTINVSLFPKQH